MRAALLIAPKDLRARFRDRSALLIGIVVPFGLAFIFNSIFGGISGASDAISLGVVDLDGGAVARVFVRTCWAASDAAGLIAVHHEATLAAGPDAGGERNGGRGHRDPARLLGPGPGEPARLHAGDRERRRADLGADRPLDRARPTPRT